MPIGVDRLVARELHAAPLRAPADRARDVQRRGRGRAARQHEARERRELGFERVDPALELVDVGLRGLGHPALRAVRGVGRRERAAEREQQRLDPREQLAQIALRGRGRGHAERGVELVDGAVGLDAQRILRDPLAAEQIGLPTVAAAGVDLHRGSPRRRRVGPSSSSSLRSTSGSSRAARRRLRSRARRVARRRNQPTSPPPRREHRDRDQ